ncbi:putative arsenate reductase (Arc2) [Aspergillus vadensis CBS 113365]|uniref:Arsenate reductase n=1 Tax=Aspergillus vadensis (strain CBS 113365 / IMI 142717 / IBT 24658) TaxID=1448311 RepID=A0A319BQF5_ASPVC|nr:arsenate reductase [Aspergillus vadensis CBS 113365]PYH67963.1 arsenate reductase [Aspergillus vadensis CBS 113365]
MMSTDTVPWHAAYPAPRSTAIGIHRKEVLGWFRSGRQPGRDFLLVDLRRTDFEGGTIRGSINLPAQTLYPAIPTLYSLLSTSLATEVVWYCGSSKGRGVRAASWFADYIEQQQDTHMRSLVLEGGIKGWVAEGKEYTDFMDEYDASAWTA